MKRLISLFIVMMSMSGLATTYTEFYCDPAGTNVNAGSTTNVISTYCCSNANWDGVSVFTLNDGRDPSLVCTTGAWVSISLDAATNAGVIGLVTGIVAGVDGTISIDTRTTNGGAGVASSATGNSLRVGGAWSGPHHASGFPFNFIQSNCTNGPSLFPRINFRTATYSITAGINDTLMGPMRFEGMTAIPGDGGRATVDGGSSANFTGITLNNINGVDLKNFTVANMGTSGSGSSGINLTGSRLCAINCVVHDIRGNGIVLNNLANYCIGCEAYACNTGNGAAQAGFSFSAGGVCVRCISHDNATANSSGFIVASTSGGFLINSIADSNAKDGLTIASSTPSTLVRGCDFYNNGASGIDSASSGLSFISIESCNFIKNGTYGITSSGSSLRSGYISQCGFGSGTMTNASGSIALNLGGIDVLGTVTYAADQLPWTDAPNGDFRISLTAAKAAGNGTFTEKAASYSGTIGYPDIGAAQSASTNAAAGGEHSHVFAQ